MLAGGDEQTPLSSHVPDAPVLTPDTLPTPFPSAPVPQSSDAFTGISDTFGPSTEDVAPLPDSSCSAPVTVDSDNEEEVPPHSAPDSLNTFVDHDLFAHIQYVEDTEGHFAASAVAETPEEELDRHIEDASLNLFSSLSSSDVSPFQHDATQGPKCFTSDSDPSATPLAPLPEGADGNGDRLDAILASAQASAPCTTTTPQSPTSPACDTACSDFNPNVRVRQLNEAENSDLLASISDDYCKLTNRSKADLASARRAGQLCVVLVVFHGVLFTALLDSGCSMRTLIDHHALAKTGLKTYPATKGKDPHMVTIGDGTKVEAQHTSKAVLNVCGYETEERPMAMKLSGEFHMVLGKQYLEHIESKSSSFNISFLNNTLDFTLKMAQNGQRKFCIQPNQLRPEYFMTPSSRVDQLMSYSEMQKTDLRGARMFMVDTRTGDWHRTKTGDDYLPCDNFFQANAAPPSCPFEPGGSMHSASEQPPGKAVPPEPDPAASTTQDSERSDEQVIADAMKIAKPANYAAPVANPSWEPSVPSPDADFSDSDFLERVQPKHNTADKLKEIEQEVGVNFVDTVLKQHGQIFRDDVPTHLVPDRGKWNAQVDFSDKSDAQRPVNLKSYRLSPAETRALALSLRDMLLRGTIRPSKSPWGAPVFLVPKSDGGWRMCCDYRILNSKLVHESYSLPAADQLFDLFKTAKYFSTHDCTWGYHQLRWSQESIPYTAIKTHLGTFEFLVMNFGPTSSPAQWQRLVEAVLRPVLGVFCVIYLDDLCIYSDTAEEHVKHLREVYRLLAQNRIYLRFGKCYFFQRAFKFLGWIIKDGTLGVDTEKVAALTTWPTPNSKREVRSFTGFCNFYRRLIPKFSVMMAPLFDLQRDTVPDSPAQFVEEKWWTDKAQKAYESAIQALTNAPVVHIAHPDRAFLLFPDASNVGVGGVLEQEHPEQKHVVVAFLSKRLNQAQAKYEAGKLELLALIVCLQQWRHYLQGCKKGFTIFTDHEPLLAIKTTKNPSRMLLRWLYFIEQFKFVVKHRKGTEQPADMLSRPREDASDPGISVTDDDSTDDVSPDLNAFFFGFSDDLEPDAPLLDTIRKATEADPWAQKVEQDPQGFPKVRLTSGLLFKQGKLFIPPTLPKVRSMLFDQVHSYPTAGHFGSKRTLAKLQRNVFWPKMAKDVTQWVSDCEVCIATKRLPNATPVPVPHDVPTECWETMFMDEVSGFPTSEGCDAIWIFVDKLSKMAHFVPITKSGFDAVALAKIVFGNVFKLHGMPSTIISDRDVRADNRFWDTLSRLANFKHNKSTPYHPQTDSTGEATVRMCIDLCSRFVNSNQDDWYELMPALEFAYNDTPTSTGFSPFEINYQRHPRSASSLLTDCLLDEGMMDTPRDPTAVAALRRYGKVIRETRANLTQLAKQIGNPEPVIHKKFRTETFKELDWVMLNKSFAGTSFPQNKMSQRWVGPFQVTARTGPNTYRLALPSSMNVPEVVNVRNLKKAPGTATPYKAKGPDMPQARLTEGPLRIFDIIVVTDADDIHDLFVSTEEGLFSAHELCQRHHFPELLEFVSALNRNRLLPYFLGRVGTHTFADKVTLDCIITAFDSRSENGRRAYQLDFDDVQLSFWAQKSQIQLKQAARPRAPAAFQFAKLSDSIPRALPLRQLHVLELCSGPNASFSSAVRLKYPDALIVTVDISAKFRPTIVADIRTWQKDDFLPPPGFFSIVWTSPPCTQYSPAQTASARDFHSADNIVRAALSIIRYMKPKVWFLENPHTTLFKRDFMKPFEQHRNLCSFCHYGTDYRKLTDIWSNVPLKLEFCSTEHRCAGFLQFNEHKRTAQAGPSGPDKKPGIPSWEANHIPERLCLHLLASAVAFLG